MKRLLVLIGILVIAMAAAAYAETECNDGIDNDGDGKIDILDLDCISPQDNSESGYNVNNKLKLTTEIVCGFTEVPKCSHIEFKKLIKICNPTGDTVTDIVFRDTLPHEVVASVNEPVFEFPPWFSRVSTGIVYVESAPPDKPDKGSSKVTWYDHGVYPDNLVGFTLKPDECATMYLWLETRSKPNNPNCPYYWSSEGTSYLDSSLNIEYTDLTGHHRESVASNDAFTLVHVGPISTQYPPDFTCKCSAIRSPTVEIIGTPKYKMLQNGQYEVNVEYRSWHPDHDPALGKFEYLDNFAYVSKTAESGTWKKVYTSYAELPTSPGTKTITFVTDLAPPFYVLDIKMDECMNAADPLVPEVIRCSSESDCPQDFVCENGICSKTTPTSYDISEVGPTQGAPEFSTLGVILILVVIAVLYPVMKSKVDLKK